MKLLQNIENSKPSHYENSLNYYPYEGQDVYTGPKENNLISNDNHGSNFLGKEQTPIVNEQISPEDVKTIAKQVKAFADYLDSLG